MSARLGSYSAVHFVPTAWILRLCTPIRVAARGYARALCWGLSSPDVDAERVSWGIGSVDGVRASVVRVEGAGSDGLVDPGAACWVGISGACLASWGERFSA